MNKIIGLVFVGLAGLAMLVLVTAGTYIVNEGHVGVITRWGRAVGQEMPAGLKFKTPIITGVKEFDVRERRALADMSAATANQLPITATVSASWRLDPSQAMDTYVNYGTPEAFESIILMPRLQQAGKAGLSQFQASDLIRDRTAAANAIFQLLSEALEEYPARLVSLQIENVDLPQRYLEAVMLKEEAREAAAKEDYNLQKQAKEAQQAVQTAEAARDAQRAQADGQAYSIRERAKAEADAVRLAGEAEAEAIRVVQQALKGDPLLVEYERAKRWNGQMPTTVLGEGPGLLMELPK